MASLKILQGQTVLITGASQGIGRSIALAFAKQDPHVLILFGRNQERLDAVASEVRKQNSAIHVITKSVDVGQSSAVYDAVSTSLSESRAKQVDVVVNNAGLAIGAPRSFPELTIEEIDTMASTNINGYMYVTHAVLNSGGSGGGGDRGGMMKSKRGTILNVESTTGLEVPPFPGEAVYHTSKAAQVAFTNVLRTELTGTNIKVLALRPGVVANTDFHALRVGHEEGKDLYDDFMKGIEPLHPDNVADAAVWMLSQPEQVAVKALDLIPTSQRSLANFDRTWNERNGKNDVKLDQQRKN